MKLEGISVEGIIKYCEKTLKELKDTNYQFGFDIFMSTDGIRFIPICLNGLGNRDTDGGRILFVSSANKNLERPFQTLTNGDIRSHN